mmetsp:Transcript_55729/g.161438  ORF Transcript_55729/g.161438 Transcript_55729/m.161438 type:complete len:401 (+) Transcript_55729:59-1261(+)
MRASNGEVERAGAVADAGQALGGAPSTVAVGPPRPRKVPVPAMAAGGGEVDGRARSVWRLPKDMPMVKPQTQHRPPRTGKKSRRWRPTGFPDEYLDPVRSALGAMLALIPLSLIILGVRTMVLRWALKTERYSVTGADDWVTHRLGGAPGFFLDIGAFGPHGFSNTRNLELKGWRGLCADPIPRETYRHRSCGFVPRPIANASGWLRLPDGCAEPDLVDGGFLDVCTRAQATTLSVRELLYIADAPSVLDYVSISVRGVGMSILEGFPWDAHCARLWTVEVDRGRPARELQLLRAKGCTSALKGAELFAECGCSGVSGPVGFGAAEASDSEIDEFGAKAGGAQPPPERRPPQFAAAAAEAPGGAAHGVGDRAPAKSRRSLPKSKPHAALARRFSAQSPTP